MPQTQMERQRKAMVERQLAGRGIKDERVLKAMGEVPREMFVPDRLKEFAYEDSARPIEAGQTISQPYIVAQMLELALHEVLVNKARERISSLGYDNVEIVLGDGTKGWPQAAPFDAILVAAGSPVVPPALKEQLVIGGRLIIPISGPTHEVLTRIRRTGEDTFEEEEHGLVAFVPLVGAGEWPPMVENNAGPPRDPLGMPSQVGDPQPVTLGPVGAVTELAIETGYRPTSNIGYELRQAALPFDLMTDLSAIATGLLGNRRIVMLGEATHGTAEFYDARAEITAELIAQHGFNIVAVEADWSDAAAYNRIIHGKPAVEPGLSSPFTRFPRWMWRNDETFHFLTRLRAGHLRPQWIDRSCAALPRPRRSGGRGHRTRALRMLDTVAVGPGGICAYGCQQHLSVLRGRSHSHADRSSRETRRVHEARRLGLLRR